MQSMRITVKSVVRKLNIRNWIQLGMFALTTGIGLQFYLFVRQASMGGPVTISRPGGVEGFLPIGALIGWKRFVVTGEWDAVHPAAMVILGFALLVSLLFHKSFCSWICPVGALSEGMWKLGGKITGKNVRIHPFIDYPLRSIKYLLLLFFVYVACSMGADEISAFIQSPYYKMADVKMLHFFTRMSLTTAVVLGVLTVGSLIFRNFWCRYFCPYGALMGIAAVFSPWRIHRHEQVCINCEKCTQACPSHLPVSRKNRINSPECTGCMDCISVCPKKDALEFKRMGGKNAGLTTGAMGTTIILIFIGVVYAAQITGHWQSMISPHEFSMRLRMIDSPELVHPAVNLKTK